MWRLFGELLNWWSQLRCDHHWHAADAMIRVVCCWCGRDDDGWLGNKTETCAWGEA